MVIAKPYPTQDVLRELLAYDPETGLLTWRTRPNPDNIAAINTWNARFAGLQAFKATSRDGFKRGSVDGRQLRADKVIWIIMYGKDPDAVVHTNGDNADDRLENLQAYDRPCARRKSDFVPKRIVRIEMITKFVKDNWPIFHDGDYQSLTVPVRRELYETVLLNDDIPKYDDHELCGLFDWSKPRQGFNYWREIQQRVQRGMK